ncbi:MAG: cation:proton antiporter, partial [Pseudomonadota bacterium]|nr:cation:proton antiporter [Pseudomonadota bacterium]
MAAVLGTALGLSSTVVAVKVLEEKRELKAFHGRVAVGILIVQDLVAVALLSYSGGEPPSPWALLVLALPLIRPQVRRLIDWTGHDELLVLYGLLLALVIGGGGFSGVGLSAELGALLLGVLLAGHPRTTELSHALWGLKETFLVGFFLNIGLAGLPTWEALGYGLLLTLLLPLKAVLFFFVLLRFRLRARSAFLAGLSLSTYSEFALIVVQFNVNNGQLPEQWLVVLAITVALSFVLAAPANRLAHGLYERLAERLGRFELAERHPDEQPITLGAAQVLILGMGPAGCAAYDFLKSRGERVVGFDSDPAEVQRNLHEGRRVVYADAEDPGLWQNLPTEGIRAILMTMPDLEAKRIAAVQLRRNGYRGLICAATQFPDQGDTLRKAGADLSFDFLHEVGVGLAEHVMLALYEEEPAAGHG